MPISDYNPIALIEAMLFASPEPVPEEKIREYLQLDGAETKKYLSMLSERYAREESGLSLIEKNGNYTVGTKIILGEAVARFLKSRKSPYLSPAALEVLSIAAYNAPVTKTYIAQIRGSPSSEIVESLVEKNLLRENGKLDLPGRPMSYVTTEKFLAVFGLDSLDDLPLPETLLPAKDEENDNPADNS